MDFDFTDAQQAFRRDVRSWLAEHVPADLRGRGFAASRGEREHVTRLRAWQRRLHGAGSIGHGIRARPLKTFSQDYLANRRRV